MQPIELQTFTYQERHELLPALTTAVSLCGAWILERRTLSPTATEFRVEIQLRHILELYAALLAAGVEPTRDGHQALSDLCTCRRHMTLDLTQVVTIRLELAFLEDMTLHSMLMAAGSAA